MFKDFQEACDETSRVGVEEDPYVSTHVRLVTSGPDFIVCADVDGNLYRHDAETRSWQVWLYDILP